MSEAGFDLQKFQKDWDEAYAEFVDAIRGTPQVEGFALVLTAEDEASIKSARGGVDDEMHRIQEGVGHLNRSDWQDAVQSMDGAFERLTFHVNVLRIHPTAIAPLNTFLNKWMTRLNDRLIPALRMLASADNVLAWTAPEVFVVADNGELSASGGAPIDGRPTMESEPSAEMTAAGTWASSELKALVVPQNAEHRDQFQRQLDDLETACRQVAAKLSQHSFAGPMLDGVRKLLTTLTVHNTTRSDASKLPDAILMADASRPLDAAELPVGNTLDSVSMVTLAPELSETMRVILSGDETVVKWSPPPLALEPRTVVTEVLRVASLVSAVLITLLATLQEEKLPGIDQIAALPDALTQQVQSLTALMRGTEGAAEVAPSEASEHLVSISSSVISPPLAPAMETEETTDVTATRVPNTTAATFRPEVAVGRRDVREEKDESKGSSSEDDEEGGTYSTLGAEDVAKLRKDLTPAIEKLQMVLTHPNEKIPLLPDFDVTMGLAEKWEDVRANVFEALDQLVTELKRLDPEDIKTAVWRVSVAIKNMAKEMVLMARHLKPTSNAPRDLSARRGVLQSLIEVDTHARLLFTEFDERFAGLDVSEAELSQARRALYAALDVTPILIGDATLTEIRQANRAVMSAAQDGEGFAYHLRSGPYPLLIIGDHHHDWIAYCDVHMPDGIRVFLSHRPGFRPGRALANFARARLKLPTGEVVAYQVAPELAPSFHDELTDTEKSGIGKPVTLLASGDSREINAARSWSRLPASPEEFWMQPRYVSLRGSFHSFLVKTDRDLAPYDLLVELDRFQSDRAFAHADAIIGRFALDRRQLGDDTTLTTRDGVERLTDENYFHDVKATALDDLRNSYGAFRAARA